jgi:PKD repeat protein
MPFTYIRRAAIALALALFAVAGCTVKSTDTPPLTGPSGLALSLNVNAIPDSINQDGASQSSVKVTAIGPDGRPLVSLPLRLDMFVGGVAQDYGTLSARSVVTNSDGVATAVYTAPASPVNGLFGTCSGLPGNCVSIVATATATNFTTANPEQVVIRLVPTGVILPPASAPIAAFSATPTPFSVNVPTNFDASASTAGTGASSITSYSWKWGDGTADSVGRIVSHAFLTAGSFNVTLTVVNDRGLTNSASQSIDVGSSDPFTGDWTVTPTPVVAGSPAFFNGDQVASSPGHQVVTFNWNFGDGDAAQPSTGSFVSHIYARAGNYQVVLSVADDVGRRKVLSPKSISVGSGAPDVQITFSPAAPARGANVNFSSNGTSASAGATITSYLWDFGDGTPGSSQVNPIHVFPTTLAPGAYSVTLTVTDDKGRVGTKTVTVTIG